MKTGKGGTVVKRSKKEQDFLIAFGKRLREGRAAMTERGDFEVTREMMAVIMNLSQSQWSRYESGQRAMPPYLIVDTCRVLRMEIKYAMTGEGKMLVDEDDGTKPFLSIVKKMPRATKVAKSKVAKRRRA